MCPHSSAGALPISASGRGLLFSARQCSAFLGEEGVTLRAMLRTGAPFSVLWSLSCYLYLLALCRISASDASAIVCCSRAFAFLLSWIGLRDTFMGVRVSGLGPPAGLWVGDRLVTWPALPTKHPAGIGVEVSLRGRRSQEISKSQQKAFCRTLGP